jgi:hypothetical protein
MNLAAALVVLLAASGPAAAPPPSIAWPEFFAHIGNQGLEYSETLKALDGKRVRLRGYAIPTPGVPGGLLLGRDASSELHDVDEIEVPYDAVGVLWKKGLALPRIPARPTVEGRLRLGNHRLGGQAVAILIEDAIPVVPAKTARASR